MKKPINPVAVVFWITAAVFVAGDIPMAMAVHELAKTLVPGGQATAVTLVNVWSETRAAVFGGGQLLGIVVLIELVDQIRWNALPPEKQVAKLRLGDLGLALRRLRTVGVSH